MNLQALVIARNEEWVIGASLRAALMYCDGAVVLLHACSDRTPEIVAEIAGEHPGRVTVIEEPEPIWREMEHRQRTLEIARSLGATHIAPVDADEILCGDTLQMVRQQIEALPPGRFAGIKMRNLHRSLEQYRSDSGIWGTQAGTMLAFADAPGLHWSAGPGGYQHHQRSPHGSRPGRFIVGGGGLMHLQFASWRRLVAKHTLYKIRDVLHSNKPAAEIDRMYSMAPNDVGAQVTPVPAAWWEPYRHLMRYMDVDAEPWQEVEARRLVEDHGLERFAGLDLFGVVESVHASR